jgi:CO/xanthine dehydrogenase FAD-binding subunit
MGAVAPTVIRCPEAEKFLESAQLPLSNEQIMQLEKIGRETAKPIDDVRSTAKYRKQMAGVLLKRAAASLA